MGYAGRPRALRGRPSVGLAPSGTPKKVLRAAARTIRFASPWVHKNDPAANRSARPCDRVSAPHAFVGAHRRVWPRHGCCPRQCGTKRRRHL